ncbi:hypothetical protein [Pseudothioclava arenosa]|nr:hypothetical protein [Pseudothioclava arenosa]
MELSLRRDREELVEAYGEELLNAELELEARMVSLGRDQIRKQIARSRELGNESGTAYGKTLIAKSVDTISAAIGRFIQKAEGAPGRQHIAVRYLKQVDSDVASYIALRMVIDGLTGKKQLLQRVAVVIGKRIEDEVRFSQFKDTYNRAYVRALEKAKKGTTYHRKKATMSGYERRFSDDEWNNWPEQDCLHLGMKLIEMITQTGLIEIGDEINTRRDTVKVIQPTAKLIEWIEREMAKSELLHPMNMPMVVKPLDWTDPYNGGYVTQDAQGKPDLTLAKLASITGWTVKELKTLLMEC